MEFKYVNQITSLIDEVIREENGNMEEAVDVLYEAINNKKSIYTFGASHAGIMSEELLHIIILIFLKMFFILQI